MKFLLAIILVPIILIGLIIGFIKYTYEIAPEYARKNGGQFVETCNNLNGETFNFENISKLNGLVFAKKTYNTTGQVPVNKEYFDSALVYNTNNSSVRIYKENFFKGPNIKYSWVCEIKTDDKGIVSSVPIFLKTD